MVLDRDIKVLQAHQIVQFSLTYIAYMCGPGGSWFIFSFTLVIV